MDHDDVWMSNGQAPQDGFSCIFKSPLDLDLDSQEYDIFKYSDLLRLAGVRKQT
jgi:hypothetical protein